ncbi:unnamed protein product [Umbelopsis sp. WA50703]
MSQETSETLSSTVPGSAAHAYTQHVEGPFEPSMKERSDEFELFEPALFAMPRIFDNGNYIVDEPGHFAVTDDKNMSLVNSPTVSATSGHSGTGSFDPPSPMQYDSVKNDDGGEDEHNLEKFSHEGMVPTLANDYLDYQQFVHSSIPLEIRVFGIPESGTKSRVETQIKLGLELVDARGERVGEWSHIKLPTHMVAREKLKRINGKTQNDDNPVSGTALHESQVLQLDAKVVCASDLTREVIMCVNCVHRERKRLQRKRDNKRAKLANKKNAKNTSITFEPLPDLEDEAVMSSERNKILQFNCCDYVDYSSGETVLPTRFTCYCRHHAEKLGFRIQLALRDHHDQVVATGISPIIMITDDHKSSKVTATTTNAASAGPRKRNREEYDSNDSNRTSGSSRKANKKKNQSTDGESDSGTSSPIASIPATPTSMQLSSIHGPLSPLTLHPSPDSFSFPTSSAAYGKMDYHDIKVQTHNLQDKSQTNSNDFLEVERFLSQLPSPVDVPISSSTAIHNSHDDFGLMNALSDLASPTTLPNGVPQPKISAQPQEQPQHVDTADHDQQVSARPSDQVPQRRPHAHINRIIPAEGPVYGGVEVTILGSGFYEGVTCLFGDSPAMPTHCWSQNTLVCILPPATNPGTVVVSLKEHPIVLDGQDVPLFTYFDESDRALMELALQVVGLKSTGKLEDARQIAMRIVQGGTGQASQSSENKEQGKQHTSYRQNATQATAIYNEAKSLYLSNMKNKVMEALQTAGNDEMCHIDTVNESGHTMLHIASLRGYADLCSALVKQGCDVNKQDRNGFTALHFASWAGHQQCVEALLDIGSVDQSIQTVQGKLPVDLAYDRDFAAIVDMLGGPLTAVDCDDSYAASSEDEFDSDDDSSDLDHAYSATYPDSSLMFQIDDSHSEGSEDDVSDLPPIRSNILLRNKSRSNRRYSALQMADWLQHSSDPTLAFASVTGDRDDTQLSELTQASLFWIRELLTEIQQRASHAIADSKVRARLTDLQQQASEALGDYTICTRISHLQKYAHTMLHDSKLRARLHELQQQASNALNDTKLKEKLTEVQQLAAHVLAESSALSQDDRALAAAIQHRLDRMATHLARVRHKLPQSARDFVRSTLQTLDDHLLMDDPFTDTDPDMEDDGWPWDNKDITDAAGPSEQAPAPLHQLTTQEQEHRHRFLNPSEEPDLQSPEAFSNTVRVHRFASRSKYRLELSSKLLSAPAAKSSDKPSETEQVISESSNSSNEEDEEEEEEEEDNGAPVYYHGAVIMDENKYLWHREKYKRLKKDKLLYLFWLPILFVVVSLLLLHYVRTNSVMYEYITGFTPSLRKIALMGKV